MTSTFQSIEIDAPVADVWERIGDFHDLSWAPNVVTSVEKVGDIEGDQVGAKRILNQMFHETLVEIDHDGCCIKYSIDDGPSPVSMDEVSNYYGLITLSPTADEKGTIVEWASSWDADNNDAVDFCHGIYVALLNDLKQSFKE